MCIYIKNLDKAGLKDSTEALIVAAHEQAQSTKSIKAGLYHTRYRLREDACEIILLIAAGCNRIE